MLNAKTLALKPETVHHISEIDEFKGLWKALERYTTGLQILGEVDRHGQSLKKVLGPLKSLPITPQLIQTLHKKISKNKETAGVFRKQPYELEFASDEFSAFLDTADPGDVEFLFEKITQWYNTAANDNDAHPLVLTALFFAVFLQISPFEDSNIEVAKFLTLLMLLKAGYEYMPYTPLDTIIESHYKDLYKALKVNQRSLENGKPDWDGWLNVFLDLLKEQKNTLQNRLDEKEQDVSKLPALSAKIMALFEEHQRLQMHEIQKLTNGRRSTLKLRLGELVEQGYLKRHGQARSTWYSMI